MKQMITPFFPYNVVDLFTRAHSNIIMIMIMLTIIIVMIMLLLAGWSWKGKKKCTTMRKNVSLATCLFHG